MIPPVLYQKSLTNALGLPRKIRCIGILTSNERYYKFLKTDYIK